MHQAYRVRIRNQPFYRGFWFGVALIVGVFLRLSWLADMEYKSDERFMFERALGLLNGTESMHWVGMPSGVMLRNPGLSIWIFQALGWVFQVQDPVSLARAVAVLNCGAILGAALFVWRWVDREDREAWYWGLALVSVNPLAIMIHRKIWAQSVLPIFCLVFLACWWTRERRVSALGWGLVGALLGQIHMSGFFYAAAFAGWTALFARRTQCRWVYWFAGSVLGALPMIPWLSYLVSESIGGKPLTSGLQEAIQLKFWVFWLNDSLGIHVGHQLGVGRGNALLDQMREFLQYPFVGGRPSWAMAGIHLVLLLAAVRVYGPGLLKLHRFRNWRGDTQSSLARNAMLFGYGGFLTALTIWVRRYYLIITFPMEWVTAAQIALKNGDIRRGRVALAVVAVCNFLISVQVMFFVHHNGGAPHGEYGISYRAQKWGEVKIPSPRTD